MPIHTWALGLLRRAQTLAYTKCPPGHDVREWLRNQEQIAQMLLEQGPALFPDAPQEDYDRETWSTEKVSRNAVPRCYSYACNTARNGYTRPGYFSLAYRTDPVSEIANAEVGDRKWTALLLCVLLERDGFIPLDTVESLLRHTQEKCWPVAVFVKPGEGFHLVRMDQGEAFPTSRETATLESISKETQLHLGTSCHTGPLKTASAITS